MQTFNDIMIQGINKNSSVMNKLGDSEIHLKLSDYPPGEWPLLFTNEWSNTWYQMKQHAEVFGSDLVIQCHPSVLVKEHLPQLEKAVAATNLEYRKQHAANEAFAQGEAETKARADKILDDLDDQFNSRER